MKHLLTLLLPLLIVGCAVSTPLLVDFRIPDTKHGDWYYNTSYDEFDGDFLRSFVQSTDNIAYMRVITSLNTNESRLEYVNGDSYICVIYSSLNTEMIFYKDDLLDEYDLFAYEDVKKVNIISRLIKSVNYLIWGDV